ncbi:unnamed protein product [Clonostachys chloroleuca]|uniref:Uncharacterized protein n=1 Tax=Clonostachys chloroleuca TaxID=1926264 RepID=A0AA35PZY9_9HYPO|nr:unnamed protein product [Clonostachys chloroleuca]
MAARVGGVGEGIYSCHPRQMITKKPLNINDEEVLDGMSLHERPLSLPTSMSYTLQMIRLAELSRNIVDRSPLMMAPFKIMEIAKKGSETTSKSGEHLDFTPEDISSYWTDFTHNFEEGVEIDPKYFNWDSIFVELDSSFI